MEESRPTSPDQWSEQHKDGDDDDEAVDHLRDEGATAGASPSASCGALPCGASSPGCGAAISAPPSPASLDEAGGSTYHGQRQWTWNRCWRLPFWRRGRGRACAVPIPRCFSPWRAPRSSSNPKRRSTLHRRLLQSCCGCSHGDGS